MISLSSSHKPKKRERSWADSYNSMKKPKPTVLTKVWELTNIGFKKFQLQHIGNKSPWRRRFWWSKEFTQLQTDKLLASCGWRVGNGNFCLNAKWALELHDWNHCCDIRYIPRSRVISCRHQCRAVIRNRNCIHSKVLRVARGD
jgi:hypothetical protein